jgi:aminopeptidase
MKMKDVRIEKLATTLLHHSVKLKKGQKVKIRGHYAAKPLNLQLVDEAMH